MNEKWAIERAQRGDLDAFGRVLREHETAAHRLAYIITAHRLDAEDAVQDAFVNAWQALDSFDSDRPVRPWLLKIVANEARMRRRASTRRWKLRANLTARVLPPATAQSPETQAVERDDVDRILAEIERLEESEATTLKLRYFAGMTTGEIAETLGEPPGTVRSRLSRATRRLRARIQDQPHDRPDESREWERPAHDRRSS